MPDQRDTLAFALDRDPPEVPLGKRWLFLNAAPLPELADATHEQPCRPGFLALRHAGRDVHSRVDETGFDGAALLLARSRRGNERLLARAWNAVREGGRVVACGAKTAGVAPLRKWAAARTDVHASLPKHHAVAFTLRREGDDWPVPEHFAEVEDGWWTTPGAFSADGPDPASAMLADHLDDVAGRVADLGAGWGYLSAKALERDIESVALFEADHAALEAARRNVEDERASFHWHDVVGEPIAQRFDTVVMNPPFHTGRAADPALGTAFIDRAAAILAPGGRLLMVANRQLPYERQLEARFGRWEKVEERAGFKVLTATR